MTGSAPPWPALYEAKRLVQRLADQADLSEGEEALIEYLHGFLEVLQDHAEEKLGVPGHLVFLHRNPDHPGHPDRP